MTEGPIFVLKGWVPASAAESLESNLGGKGLSVGLQLSEPTDDEMPPTKLQNPWWCRPIEVLYKVLGITPGYNEVDISPFFLPFLTIFTAMLFADAGYGLVALAALLLAYKPGTAAGVPKDLFQLFMVLFAGVVSYGLLTNSYFGETLIRLTPFDPMSPDGEALLKRFCFFLGSLHITIAHLWKIRRGPIGLASLSEVGWVLFVWAMYALVNVLVLGDPQPEWMLPLFGVSLLLVLVFTNPSWNPLKAIGSGLGSIALSAAAFLSDIISYIRLWAVGLAGGILAASFNELARPLPLIFAVIILVAAHFMNIALCMVAVFAHGVRLNLLEFSNHVGMEWSGREYEPFRKS
jgi:V/A-type H+/Na+-transporting ATPase subunit I